MLVVLDILIQILLTLWNLIALTNFLNINLFWMVSRAFKNAFNATKSTAHDFQLCC